jgi:hypothetical protein
VRGDQGDEDGLGAVDQGDRSARGPLAQHGSGRASWARAGRLWAAAGAALEARPFEARIHEPLADNCGILSQVIRERVTEAGYFAGTTILDD